VRVFHSDGEGMGASGFSNAAIGWGSTAAASATVPVREPVPGVPGAFHVRGLLQRGECERLISLAEDSGFTEESRLFDPNEERRSGALHAAIDFGPVFERCRKLLPASIYAFEDRDDGVTDAAWARRCPGAPEGVYKLAGISPRARVYRYRPGSGDTFRPHRDDVWPGCSLASDVDGSHEFDSIVFDKWYYAKDGGDWRFNAGDRVSQLSLLLYLNDDFEGGETTFFDGQGAETCPVEPVAGDALCFFQNFRLGRDEKFDAALAHFHEGSPVKARLGGGTRPKYAIRTDVLYYFPESRR